MNTLLSVILPIIFVGFAYSCVSSYNCPYSCPTGTKPGQNPDYKVLTSGCSQYIPGFNATFNADFDQCCQQLDYCYANCTAEKYLCDRQLKSCTDAVCQNVNLTISGIFDRLKCEALQGSLRPLIEGREHCSLVAITRVRSCCV